ncbi:hypothetical protein Tco_1040759, partial [Tanacetum coccineum]
PSSTNEVNTAYGVSTDNTQVSPASTKVSAASTQVSTASLSDATIYAFLANQPNGSQVVHEDLELIHEDGLEEIDLKWQLALLSMRTRRWDILQENAEDLGIRITGTGIKTALEELESHDALFVEELVSNDKLGKKTIFPTKINFVRPQQKEKPVRKPVKYAEMYRSQTPRGNQRNWNNQKSQQLGSDFVMYNKACFVCGSFNHVQANCNYHQRKRVVSGSNYTRVNYNYYAKKAHPSVHRNMALRAVLLKSGLRPLNIARTINTAHPKITGHPQKEDQGYVDSGCLRHMTGNMSYLSDFKEFDGEYVTFGGGAKGVFHRCVTKRTMFFFTDTGCFVLSPDFKLADESQVLLKVPRKNNMYSDVMKNIVPKESLTCLVAKATLDESML